MNKQHWEEINYVLWQMTQSVKKAEELIKKLGEDYDIQQ